MSSSAQSTVSSPITDKRPILVPVDFSSCSKNALLFASQLVRCLRAPILVLHVVHDENRNPGLYNHNGNGDGPRDFMRPIEEVAACMLKEFVEEIRDAHPESHALLSAETMLVEGLPARRIIEIAMRKDAALIVMGTHGRSGLSRLVSGSVAAEVVKRSPVPVTVVKRDALGQGDAQSIRSSRWWERRSGDECTDSHQRA